MHGLCHGNFLTQWNIVEDCGDGKYDLLGLCADCLYPCETCEGLATNCLSCVDPLVHDAEQNTCRCSSSLEEACPLCLVEDCASCPLQNLGLCTACAPPSVLVGALCAPSCPLGFYNNSGVCELCPSNCTLCESLESCQACDNGLFLLNGLCLPFCP